MVDFKKPRFAFDFRPDREVARLRRWRDEERDRQVPVRADDRLLLGSWNIANLGTQDREPAHYRLLAEVVSWFDLCAIQEVNDDLTGLRGLLGALNRRDDTWKAVFTDRAGNQERLAIVYRSDVLDLAEKFAELAIPQAEHDRIKLDGIDQKFGDFDRHPQIVTFRRQGGDDILEVVNVHLYFGKDDTPADRVASMNRRCLEAFAVGDWCRRRDEDPHTYTRLILTIGDFNLPKREPTEPLYVTLTKLGLELPEHSSKIGSSISRLATYDQIAFLPGPMKDRHMATGVFDYDGAVFPTLWEQRRERSGTKKGRTEFLSYLRYYMSDHRPIWAQFRF
jgi:hypothetical protein